MKHIHSFLLTLIPSALFAQDPFFTQAYSNPLQLNPSFSGTAGCSRAVVNYRNQWPNSTANYVTSTFSYDTHINVLHGGVGFTFLNDKSGGNIYNTTSVGIIYSPTFIIQKKVSIKPSFETNFFQKSVDRSQLTFSDMIAPGYGFVYKIIETQSSTIKSSGFDFSGGLLINTSTFNFGMALYHLNKPDEGLIGTSLINRKISVHTSYTFSKKDGAKFSFTPAVFFVKQGVYHLLMTSINFKYKWVRSGISWHSYGNIFSLMLGVNYNRFTLNYSYDLNPSGVTNTGGTHEVSFVCLFGYKKRGEAIKDIESSVTERKKYKIIPLKVGAF
jgi:type IX secretion system PorP/SprF family membrane protein